MDNLSGSSDCTLDKWKNWVEFNPPENFCTNIYDLYYGTCDTTAYFSNVRQSCTIGEIMVDESLMTGIYTQGSPSEDGQYQLLQGMRVYICK